MKKCIVKGLLSADDKRIEVTVYDDQHGIESAYITKKGDLIAEFATIADLEKWNDNIEKEDKYNPYGWTVNAKGEKEHSGSSGDQKILQV